VVKIEIFKKSSPLIIKINVLQVDIMTIYLADNSITTEPGKLADIANQVQPRTVWTAAAHNFVRAHEKELRNAGLFPKDYNPNNWFWTGDGSQFGSRDNGPVNYLSPAKYNLVLRHAAIACSQILRRGFYQPTAEEAREVITAIQNGEGVAIRLNALNLKRVNQGDSYGYVLIQTRDAADKLKGEARVMAEHTYGRGTLFEDCMKDLYDRGHNEIRMWNAMPDYAMQVLKEMEGNSVAIKEDTTSALASCLSGLVNGSRFNANDWGVGRPYGRLRGVPVKAAEGDEPQQKN
jgi:hypothetical protein